MQIETSQSSEEILLQLKNELIKAGEGDGRYFRVFNLSSVKAAGLSADSRMVVLRAFNDEWEFEFYTDIRSSKIEQIRTCPKVSALFWDPENRIQVRIDAESSVHNRDIISEEKWSLVQGDAQKAYTSLVAPGTPIEKPGEAHKWPEVFSSDYFSVVRCAANNIKILQLSGREHLALEFRRNKIKSAWIGKWIAP